MKNILFVLLALYVLASCRNPSSQMPKTFKSVDIKTLLADSLLNVRALELYTKERMGVFATARGEIGFFSTQEDHKINIAYTLKKDRSIPNFRSLAINKNGAFLMNIASPAYIFKAGLDGYEVVFMDDHPKAFYDSMTFWNDLEGIAMGDPTEDCISILITRDAGNTWRKIPCNKLPKCKEGEAAFAASDTNIAIYENHCWIATGGMFSRVFYSSDKGKTWSVYDTPVVQGKETTGLYSIDFYDAKNGIAIGGDYTNPEGNLANKLRTKDGGKIWQLVANGSGPGYRSCVQYVPNGHAQELITIGFKGIDYSRDAGETWQHLSDEGFFTFRFLNDSTAYAAGNGRVSKLMFRY